MIFHIAAHRGLSPIIRARPPVFLAKPGTGRFVTGKGMELEWKQNEEGK